MQDEARQSQNSRHNTIIPERVQRKQQARKRTVANKAQSHRKKNRKQARDSDEQAKQCEHDQRKIPSRPNALKKQKVPRAGISRAAKRRRAKANEKLPQANDEPEARMKNIQLEEVEARWVGGMRKPWNRRARRSRKIKKERQRSEVQTEKNRRNGRRKTATRSGWFTFIMLLIIILMTAQGHDKAIQGAKKSPGHHEENSDTEDLNKALDKLTHSKAALVDREGGTTRALPNQRPNRRCVPPVGRTLGSTEMEPGVAICPQIQAGKEERARRRTRKGKEHTRRDISMAEPHEGKGRNDEADKIPSISKNHARPEELVCLGDDGGQSGTPPEPRHASPLKDQPGSIGGKESTVEFGTEDGVQRCANECGNQRGRPTNDESFGTNATGRRNEIKPQGRKNWKSKSRRRRARQMEQERKENRGKQEATNILATKVKGTALHKAQGCSVRAHLIATGIEPHTGPGWSTMKQTMERVKNFGIWGSWNNPHETENEEEDHFIIDICNITSFNRQANVILDSNSHMWLVQETAATKSVVGMWRQKFKDVGWTILMSPTAPQPKGSGVGCLIREPLQAVPVRYNTKRARIAYEQGRLAMYWVQNGGRRAIFATVYGKTGGHEDHEAAQVTDDLLEICVEEFTTHPGIPKCITGDLNAEPEDLPMFMHLTEEMGWLDCGAKADIWGGFTYQPTCKAPSAKKETRRDYVLADPDFGPMVRKFEVITEDKIPTHTKY